MARSRRPIVPAPGGVEVKVDIDDGPSVEITKDGPRATRVARVFGLPGDGASRLWHALNAKGIPRYGDFHPVYPGSLPVGRIHAALDEGSTDIATVTCEYFYPTGGNMHFANIEDVRESGLPQLEITSTVQPTRTQMAYWQYGPQVSEHLQPLWLKWRDNPQARALRENPSATGPWPEPGPWQYQGGDVELQLPMMAFRYTRREPSDTYIGDKAREFVGTINETHIFGNPDQQGSGDSPRTWLCSRIDGVSDDGGQTYNATYEFQYKADTWDAVIVFTDPATGKPVDGPVWGESIRKVRVYRLADFHALGLTIND